MTTEPDPFDSELAPDPLGEVIPSPPITDGVRIRARWADVPYPFEPHDCDDCDLAPSEDAEYSEAPWPKGEIVPTVDGGQRRAVPHDTDDSDQCDDFHIRDVEK